jgi:hemerythrin superfamily protein
VRAVETPPQRRQEQKEGVMTPTDDVLELVVQDHAEIKTLMNELATAPAAQDDIFERLVAKLATHETAEEEVVHPLARREAGADAVVDQLLEEESKGKEALAELEKIGVTDPQFASKFERVRSEVLRHAEHEEHDEHPRIRASVDADRLNRAAGIFETAQKIGPTHAHAHAPESATGNVVVGTFVAVADRVRDAVRDATKKAG